MNTSRILSATLLVADGLEMTTSDVQRAIYDCLVVYIPESCARFQILTKVRKLQGAKIFSLELVGKFQEELSSKPEPEEETLIVDPVVIGSSPLLTPCELKVFKLMAQGLPYKRIADMLGIADSTVKNHRASIFHKLCATNRIEATIYGLRLKLISLSEFLGLEK